MNEVTAQKSKSDFEMKQQKQQNNGCSRSCMSPGGTVKVVLQIGTQGQLAYASLCDSSFKDALKMH